MIDIVARFALFPVLAAQAVYARKKALSLPEPEGPREGNTGAGPQIRLLITGDSSAAGVGTSHQDEALSGHLRRYLSKKNRVDWVVDAKTGATTADTIQRLKARPDEKFHVISVSLGVNDVTKLVSLRSWLQQQSKLLDLLQYKFDAQVIGVSGVPPLGSFPLLPQPLRWVLGCQAVRFDRHLRALIAARPECRYVDMDFDLDASLMSEDGFHPGPMIYSEWGKRVYAALRDDLQKRLPDQAGRTV